MNMEITELDQKKMYKYLEINKVNGINHIIKKEKKILSENKSHFKKRIEHKK